MASQVRPYRLRFWLQLFGFVLLLPSMAFSSYLVVSDYRNNVDEGEQAMRRRAQVVGLAVNERLIQVEEVASTLAASPFAEQDDIPGLYEFARNVQRRIPLISRFALVEPSGRAVFSTLYPLGQKLGEAPDYGDIQKVLATGKSAVSSFYVSASSHIKTVAVDVPVFRDGKVAYVLRALLFAGSFDEMLRQQTMRAGWSASILDQNGTRLARIPSEPALIGLQAPPAVIAAVRRGDDTIFDAGSPLNGESSRALVVPIAGWGWSVVANVPQATLVEDLKQKLTKLILVITMILAGAMTFSIVVARRVDREFRDALAGPMGLVGKMEVKPSRIAEANEIAQARRETEVMRSLIMENALAESEARLRSLFDESMDAVLLTVPDGRILAANPAAHQLFGYSQAELCTIGREGITVGSDPRLASALLERERAKGVRAELTLRRKDGTQFEAEISSRIFQTADGSLQTSMIIRDISEHKAMEAEIARRAEQFGLFIDQAPTAIAMFDQEMRYLAISRRWREDYRLDDRALIGKSHYDLFPGIPERWREALRRALAGEVLSRDEDLLIRKSGGELWLRWEARPWQEPDGKIGGVVIFSEDITERKTYENRANQSAALTRSLLDSLDLSVALLDGNGIIEQVNRVWRDVSCENGGSDELTRGVGVNYLAACQRAADQGEPSAIQAISGIRQVLAGEIGIFRMEYPCDAFDKKLWFLLVVASLESNRDKLVVTHTNITPLKRALTSITQYKHIVENAPIPLMLIDRNFRFIVDNPFHATMLGMTTGDVVGRLCSEVLPPELYAKVEPHLAQGMRGIPQQYTLDQTYPDGRSYAFEVKLQPYYLDQEVEGVVATMHDVTELTEAKRLLESHQEHLEHLVDARTAQLVGARKRTQLVLDSSADGIIGVDDQNNILLCNPAALALLGYGFEELEGRNVHAAIHYRHADGSPYPEDQCAAVAAIRHGHAIRVEYDTFWHKDGHSLPVSAATHPIIEDGRVVGAVMNFRDISDRLKVEAAREEARQAAERLARMKSEFLSNMSHEIRTPLNGVLGLANIGVRESRDHPGALARFTGILNSGNLLLAIVNDILDLSKIDAGKLAVEHIPFDPGHLCEVVMETVGASADAKNLKMFLLKDENLPAACLGDPTRIIQILLNLLSNAIKFTEKGDVRITLSCADERLSVAVTDSGIGIAPEDLDRMFHPFEQLDGSTTRKFGGTGLGLTISRRLADLMGGELSVRSVVGQGSRFELRLPLVKTAASPLPLKSDPGQSGRRLNGLHILVAEDNEVNQFVLEDLLRREGAEAVFVANGRRAVEAVEDGPNCFDVLLMDVQMPEMDGLEATRRILKLAPGLPIIGQTAHALREEHQRCIAVGMATVVTKPIDDGARQRK